MTCQNCHTPREAGGVPMFDKQLAGGLTFDQPPFKVTVSNITPERDTGIGAWSDDDIKKPMRTGIRPDGVAVAAAMPTGFYEILTPSDLDAIVAYLRSVKPVSNKVADPVYKIALPRQVFPGGEKPMAQNELGDKIKRGFYLATIGHCLECHTPFAADGPVDIKNARGKRERKFPGPWGESVSKNITAHKEKGIGAWSDAEVKRAITDGLSKDGQKLKPPTGYGFYAKMTSDDLDAVIAYLRTLPPNE